MAMLLPFISTTGDDLIAFMQDDSQFEVTVEVLFKVVVIDVHAVSKHG
jgi:hypothetical protein